MIKNWLTSVCTVVLFFAPMVHGSSLQAVSSKPKVIEHGHFQLHKMEQPIGEESYEITKDGNTVSVKMDFKFTDRGSPVQLSATFTGVARSYSRIL